MSYCETSAKVNFGIDELFNSIIANINVGGKSKRTKSLGEYPNNVTNSAVEINRAKIVKIQKEQTKRHPCCYV